MSKHKVCFSCADANYFQMFGQSQEYNFEQFADKYISKLTDEEKIKCVICENTKLYQCDKYGHWTESFANKR